MYSIIVPAVAACLSMCAGLWFVFHRFRAPVFSLAKVDLSDLFNVDLSVRYRPMHRLLDQADQHFVASHTAYNRKIAGRLRSERRRVFRQYLRCLGRDHARICMAIRAVMVQSQIDRPDLAKALFRTRVLFAAMIFTVECRLFLHALGWGAVKTEGLVESIEAMRIQLQIVGQIQQAAA